ncbi:YkvA family protein [Anaerosinus sp.]|uniref:YkvA family protein n=1 Tax=Selenobaculum sp. TaxID=3074374 RepID=UPI003AB50844
MVKNGIWVKIVQIFDFLRKYMLILFFAWRHPQTPKQIKTILLILAGYLISPIDIIPDYIPFVGLIDDMAIIPAAMMLVSNFLPASVMADCQRDCARWQRRFPYILWGVALLSILWIGALIYGLYHLFT